MVKNFIFYIFQFIDILPHDDIMTKLQKVYKIEYLDNRSLANRGSTVIIYLINAP